MASIVQSDHPQSDTPRNLSAEGGMIVSIDSWNRERGDEFAWAISRGPHDQHHLVIFIAAYRSTILDGGP
jgi:hypothetical protein